MQRTRSEFQFDRSAENPPTPFETGTNRYEMRCGLCGDPMFVDRSMYEKIARAFEQGLEDNPLVCAECEIDFEEERPVS